MTTETPTTATTSEASAPTPAASPSTTTESNTATPPVTSEPSGVVANEPESGDLFRGLGEDIEDILGSEKPPVAPVATPVATPAPQAKVGATPPVPAAPPVVNPEVPVVAATTPPSEPTAPSSGDSKPEGIDGVLSALKEQEGKLLEDLSAGFALSPEDVTALEVDAVVHTPKLLARTYLRSVETSLQYMKQLIPSMLKQGMTQMRTEMEAEQAFFSQFPSLKKETHGKDVTDFALAFRHTNPQITRDALMKAVGAAVMAKHGISSAGGSLAPAAVASSGMNGAGVVKTAPFTPAPSGVVTHTQQVAPSPWEGLGHEFE